MSRLYPAFPLLLLSLVFATPLLAQPFSFFDGPTVNTCSRTFVDLGGTAGGHGNSGMLETITICSTEGPGTGVILNFTELNINGTMRLYNGTDNTGTELAIFDSGSDPIPVRTTEPNPSGCMTVTFSAVGNAPGWVAVVDCAVQCQPVEAVLLTTNPAADAGGYINICPGDEVSFTGTGNYPEAGTIYEQSDASSDFLWSFQDGNTATGTTVTNTFAEPGGYVVEVTITDRRGCRNTNRISQRVRVAPPPNFLPPVDFPESTCVEEAISITTSDALIPSDITVFPRPDTIAFTTQQSRTDTVALPDGVGIPYFSPLIYQIFEPGQRLTNLNQLVAVCANLEHSYLGDLDIWLTCPDGNRVDLVRSEGGDGVGFIRLGEGSRATLDTPDEGAVYCWTPTAAQTMDRWVRDNNPPADMGLGGLLEPGNYLPEGSFNNIVGCELNGEWVINFIDNLGTDQGYIFNWELIFTAETYPVPEEFSVQLVDVSWRPTNNLAFYSPDSIVYQPSNPGVSLLQLRTTDDYGCVYDTTYTIAARSPLDPACHDCGPLLDRNLLDTSVCAGSDFQPGVVDVASNDTLITWEYFSDAELSRDRYPNQNRSLELPISVAFQQPERITNAGEEIARVCVNLDNPADDLSDVVLELIAPNGRILTLISNLGGAGDDLRQTCFSPTATVPIGSGTPPYTGTFQPFSGGWANFNNSAINGDWILRAYDRAGAGISTLVSWDITFRQRPELTYNWSPAAGLSCTDCPNPVITAAAARNYTLTVSDRYGCTDQATVTVGITELDITVTADVTPPGCPNESSGNISLTVSGTEPAYVYAWSDGMTNGPVINGIPAGTYTVTVSNPAGCEEVFNYTLTDPEVAGLVVDLDADASCFGAADGQIGLSTTGGTGPFTFEWTAVLVDPTVVFNDPETEDIGALTAGVYTVLATDTRGCQATETITINQPDPLTLTFNSYNVTCLGADDGSIRIIPTGGDGNYSYNWQTNEVRDSIFGLTQGNYSVTVTDGQGCTATATGSVEEPTEIMMVFATQDQLGCNGIDDNVATVTATGGYGNYTYRWSNGEIAATAVLLPAGPASVTVTDAGGCEMIASLNVLELPPVTVDIILNLPSCNGAVDGAVGARPAGGAGTTDTDYTYRWSNNAATSAITGVAGGQTYSVTVTDGRGCTATAERFLPNQVPITFILEETSVNCSGESTGGLSLRDVQGPIPGNYDFQWDAAAGNARTASVSNLPAGDYTVRITDEIGQCSIDTTLTIREPAAITAELNRNNVGCFGDSDGRLSVTASGGSGGYTYAWSNSGNSNLIANLSAGDYTLTITDVNGCELIETYTITQPDILIAQATAQPALCFGENSGSIRISALGGRAPFSYSIDNRGYTRNPSFQALPAMDYLVFVRDSSGCTSNAAVTVPEGPVFGIELGEDFEIPFGDSVVLMADIEGGIGELTYQWRGSYGGTLSCDSCPDPVALPPYEIDYTLSVTDENGCSDEDRVRVSVPKIREVAVPTGFTPNGDNVNDRLVVHGRPGTRIVQFSVFDRWGGLLFEDVDYEVNDPSRGWNGEVDDKPVNGGVYFYKLVVRYEDDSQETLAGETTLIR